jgi:REP element-mobilizing transposase RayT
MKIYYRRHLPHWQPAGKVFFVTFRLFGSLPKKVIDRIREDAERIRKQPSRPKETSVQRESDDSKRIFAIYEKALDEILQRSDTDPPLWLADGRVAGIVQQAIRHRDERAFVLHRYAIMPNHVHLLIKPLPEGEEAVSAGQDQDADEISYRSLKSIMGGLKQHTARQANRVLGRSGPFWQQEYYDHWVRTDEEYYRVIRYIDRNPVVAGLCADPAHWPWSSAGEM